MKLKINKTFILYVFSAGSSFVIDLLLFTLFNLSLENIIGNFSIILATVLARILSSLYNFLINSKEKQNFTLVMHKAQSLLGRDCHHNYANRIYSFYYIYQSILAV